MTSNNPYKAIPSLLQMKHSEPSGDSQGPAEVSRGQLSSLTWGAGDSTVTCFLSNQSGFPETTHLRAASLNLLQDSRSVARNSLLTHAGPWAASGSGVTVLQRKRRPGPVPKCMPLRGVGQSCHGVYSMDFEGKHLTDESFSSCYCQNN